MLYLHVIRLDGSVTTSHTNVGYYYWTLHYCAVQQLTVSSRERNTCVFIIVINAVESSRREESGKDINNRSISYLKCDKWLLGCAQIV